MNKTAQVRAPWKTMAFGMALAVSAGYGTHVRRPPALQGQPCRSASDTAQLAMTFARHGLSDNDSAGLVALGLPYRPSALSLATDSVTCQIIIDAYNTSLADTLHRITSGYVVQADSAFVLYLPGGSGTPNATEEIAYFDGQKRFLFVQATLR